MSLPVNNWRIVVIQLADSDRRRTAVQSIARRHTAVLGEIEKSSGTRLQPALIARAI
jgi:hypothetical protein